MSLRRDYWHESDLGRFKVSVQEPDFPKGSNSTWMLTFPENGLTFESCFQSLFNLVDSSSPLSGFRIIHIDPVGLQPGDAFVFLPIQGLSIRDFHDTSRSILSCFSDQVMIVCRHYNIESFIGVGVGLGSYVLTSFAISNPRMVQGLILISSSWKASSFPAKAYYQVSFCFVQSHNHVERQIVWILSGRGIHNQSFANKVHMLSKHIKSPFIHIIECTGNKYGFVSVP